ncbi:MAG: ATP-binding protein [Methylococcaceae bacterium]|nr:ATP-binding protein [Methylococcaceae bacterium]
MKSIRRHLLLALLGTISLALIASTVAIYRAALGEVDDLFDYQLRQLALSLRDQALHNTFAPPAEGDEEGFDFVIQVWSPEGVRVYYSQPHRVLPGLVQIGYNTIQTPEGNWRVFATQLHSVVIQVAQPMQVRNRMALEAAVRLLIPLFLLLPVLSVLIWIIVSRGLDPLNRLAQAVDTRTPKALEPLPEKKAPQEVLPLVRSLNDLLGRLSEALAAQKAFIADAAHELRTPIAALQLQAQLVERAQTEEESRAAREDLMAGIQRAGHAVRQLLTLARQEPDMVVKPWVAVNLAELARSVVADQIVLAAAKSIDLGLAAIDEKAGIMGDAEGLRILLANLVENAVRYTPDGGRVDICVDLEEDERPAIEVCDTGPGIPLQDQARVFDRFYRGEQIQAPGTGLGLAIVKTIADRHGARVELNNAEAGGLRVRVVFPASA